MRRLVSHSIKFKNKEFDSSLNLQTYNIVLKSGRSGRSIRIRPIPKQAGLKKKHEEKIRYDAVKNPVATH
jgi:hypothetical protein